MSQIIRDHNKTAIISFGHRVSYKEMLGHIASFSALSPCGQDTRTVIFSENRAGWIYAFYAVWANRGIAVPVDAASTVEDLSYVLSDCQPQCIWTSRTKVHIALSALKMASCDADVKIIDEYENMPVDCVSDTVETNDNDTALIIYSSGTSGMPKGVMLSFGNIMVETHFLTDEENYFNTATNTLVLLPLHHIFPLMGTIVIPFYSGGSIAICPSLSGPDIMRTLKIGKIDMFVGVPRLWQTFYEGVRKQIDSHLLTRVLFSICSVIRSRSLSRIIFRQVHKKLGGNLKYCISAGAALDTKIFCGFRTLGIDIYEGYGMTETSPMVTCPRHNERLIPGCVGRPLPGVECKLVDDELCVKGPMVMQGYYNRPEETAAIFDADGFLHTGDLARFDEKGGVYIIGQKKNVIILPSGKNIQPVEIEKKIESHYDRVNEVAVVRDNNVLCAIIVPQPQWAKGMADEDILKELKRTVVEPYNLTVPDYRKLMRVFVCRDSLPRTRLGKLQRFKLDGILKGNPEAIREEHIIVEPVFEEYRILKSHIQEMKKTPVRPTDNMETDLALDSLDKVELQVFIGQTFGVQLKADIMTGFKDVSELAVYVAGCKTRMSVRDVDWHEILQQPADNRKMPKTTVLYPFFRRCLLLFLRHYNHMEVTGIENIPVKEPFIIVSNHASPLDAAIITSGFKKSTFINTFLTVKESHCKSRGRRFLAHLNNIIIIEEKDIKGSLLSISKVLDNGKNVVIFPEGTRTLTGATLEFRKTFAILSKEYGVPIVPAFIRGTFEAFPRRTMDFNPHKVCVEYMPAIYPDGDSSYESLATQVKSAIDNKLRQYKSSDNDA